MVKEKGMEKRRGWISEYEIGESRKGDEGKRKRGEKGRGKEGTWKRRKNKLSD